MVTLTATGRIYGSKTEVEVTYNGKGFLCLFNGEEDLLYESWLMKQIAKPPPIGGTYIPDPMSAMAALSCLQFGFFDERGSEIKVKVEGDVGIIPQPAGGGAVY